MGCVDSYADKIVRLKNKLEDWAEWYRGYMPNLGANSGAFMKTTGGHDFESLFAAAEKTAFKAIEVAVDDLTPAQGAAIRRRYLGETWRFPRDNYAVLLDDAHDALLISLPKRNVML